jgi:phosphoribosylformimino-5-aminoimidazole carboxamide ribotide isomerase
VVAQGIRHILVLDLLDVGTSGGTSTLALAGAIKAAAPQVSLIGGGGVRGGGDLRELMEAGYEGALVASALHDGRLNAEEITSFNRPLP